MKIEIVAYLVLFISVGVLFLFASLLLGWFIRPRKPSAVKGEAYECGEPAVGSAFIQFDLRFYVVALLFIIFEVELAFFFPPAVVFGKVNQLRGPNFGPIFDQSADMEMRLTPPAKEKFSELGIPAASIERMENYLPEEHNIVVQSNRRIETIAEQQLSGDFRDLALMALLDIGVFFVVLLVGFAYLWKQGDLNWVRAVARPVAQEKVKLAVLSHAGEKP